MFGISSAPAIWQRLIEMILVDVPGIAIYLDDIVVTGPDDSVHLKRLNLLFQTLQKWNIKVNFDKCSLFQDSIEYCGFRIDRHGIHKMKAKITAMVNMSEPKNRDQVKALVGLVNYYGRFFENLSTVLFPINNLLKKDVPFKWDQRCRNALNQVKEEMCTDKFLTHFNPKLPLVLATDASPYGVGAVLSHRFPDGGEKAIMYASQTLTRTQQSYSQLDKEAYAIVFGVRKFYQYVFGRKFILITDNKPVAQIFSPAKGLPVLSATRMQHYAFFLQAFDFVIECKKTSENGNADGFSRLPCKSLSQFEADEIDLVESELIQTLPLSVEELSKHTFEDKEVTNLLSGLKYGRQVFPEHRFGIEQTEFSLQKGCIMRGIRAYIPKALRRVVLEELHSSHFGSTRMKSLARSYCWWRGMDKDIEEMSENCGNCQKTRPNPKKAPLHPWEKAKSPFERVHGDFAGPFRGKLYFLLVDAYSKWPEIFIIRRMNTHETITICDEIFARFGFPDVFVSDRGVQFMSSEFQKYLKLRGIYHKKGSPYHPSTNKQVERYVQTMKKKLEAFSDSSNTEAQLSKLLMDYRNCIHPTTNKSPAMLMIGRGLRTRLDIMMPNSNAERPKNNIPTETRVLKVGDRVAAREYIDLKTRWQFGYVIKVLGTLNYEIELDDGRKWSRHIDQLRKIGESAHFNEKETEEFSGFPPTVRSIPVIEQSNGNDEINTDNTESALAHDERTDGYITDTTTPNAGIVRRSQRTIKPPA